VFQRPLTSLQRAKSRGVALYRRNRSGDCRLWKITSPLPDQRFPIVLRHLTNHQSKKGAADVKVKRVELPLTNSLHVRITTKGCGRARCPECAAKNENPRPPHRPLRSSISSITVGLAGSLPRASFAGRPRWITPIRTILEFDFVGPHAHGSVDPPRSGPPRAFGRQLPGPRPLRRLVAI